MFQTSLKFLACLIFGIALSFTQAPYHYWFLIFPIFSGFYYLFTQLDTKKSVFFASFLFGIGYFVAGLNWIGNALLVEGNEFRWVWPLAVIALPTLLSLFTALFTTIAHMISNKKSILGFLCFCALLSFSEYVRGYIFTGFPWNLYGYTWLGLLPIAQTVSVIGPYGLTFLTILWGASFGYLYIQKQKGVISIAIFAIIFLICLSYGQVRLGTSEVTYDESVQVKIIQPNIAQETKWKPQELAANFETLVSLSQSASDKKTVIIWPETAVAPTLINSLTAKERFQSFLKQEKKILLAGALAAYPDTNNEKITYHNSLFLFDGENEPQEIYIKSHLVPFGEYIPFQKYIPITPVVNFTGFKKGNGTTTVDIDGFPTLSPQICYEIIFPQKAVSKTHDRPDYILTVTNDAWYGDSAGPRQHFAIARFRAIEQGIPVIRSANTGISGIIDPYGRVIEKLDLFVKGSIEQDFPNPLENKTIYSRFYDVFYLFIIIFLCVFSYFRHKD